MVGDAKLVLRQLSDAARSNQWKRLSQSDWLQEIADVSFHLTPQTLEVELRKLEKKVPLLLHHLKPACVERIKKEVKELRNPDLEFLEQGKEYKF